MIPTKGMKGVRERVCFEKLYTNFRIIVGIKLLQRYRMLFR